MNTKFFIDALNSGHGDIEGMAHDMWTVGPHMVGYDVNANFLTVYAVHDIPLINQFDRLIATVLHNMIRNYPATKTTIANEHFVIAHDTYTSSVADFNRRLNLNEMALLQTYQGVLRLLGVQ